MRHAWLAVIAWCSSACGSAGPRPTLAILDIDPSCPAPGGTIQLTLGGGDIPSCDAGKIYADGRELYSLGVEAGAPLVLIARLPAGFALRDGTEIKVVCGAASASTRWFGVCTADGGRPEAAADDEPIPDASTSCGQPIEAVLEVVDRDGRAFPRDDDGAFQVPLNARDFSFDAGKSRNVSGRDMTHTFDSDCFPRVMVRAPVLGGLSTDGLWLGRRCTCKLEIVDRGCSEPRLARVESSFEIVPAP
jgi:hypothetical protein